MKPEKIDRRVRYTKMVIRDSFIQLLKEKPLSKITIKELCDMADINRATFYAHYLDQYDLLRQMEKELIDGIRQHLDDYNLQNATSAPLEMLIKILEFIKENAQLFDLLLNFNGDIEFQGDVIELIGQQYFYSIHTQNDVSENDKEYIFLFLANGSIGIIRKWLADGLVRSTKEIGYLLMRLATTGLPHA